MNLHLKNILVETIRSWGTEIYIGCSGDLGIERLAGKLGIITHGNDITLYSYALASYYNNTGLSIPIINHDYDWLYPYMKNQLSATATILLCYQMLMDAERQEPYFVRRRSAYKAQFERLHNATTHKLEIFKRDIRLDSFYLGDIKNYIQTIPYTAAFVCHVPFFTSKNKNINKFISTVFQWEEPTHKKFNADYLCQIVQDRANWCIISDEMITGTAIDMSARLTGKIQTGFRNSPTYIYTSNGRKHLLTHALSTEKINTPIFSEGDIITNITKLNIAPITQGQMNTLRSMYLNPLIAPSNASLNVAVLLENKIAGAFALSRTPRNIAGAYLMSDFSVGNTKYKNLSKLILYVALSNETHQLMQQCLKEHITCILTTAFTERPSSMKYRGLFTLDSRKDNPPRLNYGSDTNRWTLQEALKKWLMKV